MAEWTKSFDEHIQPWILEAVGPDPTPALLAALSACGTATEDEIFPWTPPDEPESEVEGDSQGPATTVSMERGVNGNSESAQPPKKRRRQDPVSTLGSETTKDANDRVAKIPIILPSRLPAVLKPHESLTLSLNIEKSHRELQADHHLDQIRTHLITAFGREAAPPKHPGQTLGTRSQAAVKRKWTDVHASADSYRRARIALLALGMPDDDLRFRPLAKSDLAPFLLFSEDEELVSAMSAISGEKRRVQLMQIESLSKERSWIWEKLQFTETDDPKVGTYFAESMDLHHTV